MLKNVPGKWVCQDLCKEPATRPKNDKKRSPKSSQMLQKCSPNPPKGVQNCTKVAPCWETSKKVSTMTTFASQSSPGGSQRGPNKPKWSQIGSSLVPKSPPEGPKRGKFGTSRAFWEIFWASYETNMIYCKPTFSLGRRKSFLRFTGYSLSDVRLLEGSCGKTCIFEGPVLFWEALVVFFCHLG